MSVSVSEVKNNLEIQSTQNPGEREQKTSRMTNQIFIIMRHADKERGVIDPSITEKGKMRTKMAAEVIQGIAKEQGKSQIRLIVSSLKRSQETGAVLAEALKIDALPAVEIRIRERDQTLLSAEAKKVHPQYQYYKTITDEKERFHAISAPGAETEAEQFQRMQEGIHARLDAHEDRAILPVFVAHQTVMQSLFQGLKLENQLNDEAFLKKSKYCEIFVIERKEGKFVPLARKQVVSTFHPIVV